MAFITDWAESALDDLEQIVRYIAEDKPDAAKRIIGTAEQILHSYKHVIKSKRVASGLMNRFAYALS